MKWVPIQWYQQNMFAVPLLFFIIIWGMHIKLVGKEPFFCIIVKSYVHIQCIYKLICCWAGKKFSAFYRLSWIWMYAQTTLSETACGVHWTTIPNFIYGLGAHFQGSQIPSVCGRSISIIFRVGGESEEDRILLIIY